MQIVYLIRDFFLSRIYIKNLQLNNKRINVPILKWANGLNGHFPKDVQMAKKDIKRCTASLDMRKPLQTKTTMRYLFTPIRMARIKKTDSDRCW